MSYEVILLSGQSPSNLVINRFAGPYRLATELRARNIPTKVLLGLSYFSGDELLEMFKKCVDARTLVIGISTTFLASFSIRYSLFKKRVLPRDNMINEIAYAITSIRELYPQIKLVIGGPYARKFSRGLTNINLYVEGYADRILPNYVDELKKLRPKTRYFQFHNNAPLITQQSDTSFDFRHSQIAYDLDDNILRGETLALELARGCIFNCKFCGTPDRGKSIKDNSFLKDENIVYSELMRNYDNFGTTNYIVIDDTFNDSVDKIQILHSVLTKLPFKLRLSAYIRIDLLHAHPHTIPLLWEMGLRGAFFGIESLHTPTRKTISKGFDLDKLLKILDKVNSSWPDVYKTSSFVFGLPKDTPETITAWTNDLILGSGLFDTHDVIAQPLYLANPAMSTYMSEFDANAEKYGYILKDGKNWNNDVTSYQEMFDLASWANVRFAEIRRPFSSFQMVTLHGYGLTNEELSRIDSHRDEDIEYIQNLTDEMYSKYMASVLKD
jgi:hypothetical protein